MAGSRQRPALPHVVARRHGRSPPLLPGGRRSGRTDTHGQGLQWRTVRRRLQRVASCRPAARRDWRPASGCADRSRHPGLSTTCRGGRKASGISSAWATRATSSTSAERPGDAARVGGRGDDPSEEADADPVPNRIDSEVDRADDSGDGIDAVLRLRSPVDDLVGHRLRRHAVQRRRSGLFQVDAAIAAVP